MVDSGNLPVKRESFLCYTKVSYYDLNRDVSVFSLDDGLFCLEKGQLMSNVLNVNAF